MANKEIFLNQEGSFPKSSEEWMLDSHSFYNGFWHDKKTFQTTITDQQGKELYLQSDRWEIQYQGEIIAEAISCVFSDTGLPWIKVNFISSITPEQKQALEASLKHYGATRNV